MYLSEIAIYAAEAIVERFQGGFVQEFHRNTCCITEHYTDLIHRQIRTASDRKVLFYFSDEVDSPPTSYGVLNCIWPFDFASYIMKPKEEKKVHLAATMQEALVWIAKERNWNVEPLSEAYEVLRSRNYKYVGYSKKSWLSPTREYRARIMFDFDLEEVSLFVVFADATTDEVVCQKKIAEAAPETGCLYDYLRFGNWISEKAFVVESSSFSRQTWTATIN